MPTATSPHCGQRGRRNWPPRNWRPPGRVRPSLMPTHAEKRILRYTPEQLFDVVADVRRYPEFLPWCVAARVVSHTETELVADLTIGFKLFRETFRSQVTLDR